MANRGTDAAMSLLSTGQVLVSGGIFAGPEATAELWGSPVGVLDGGPGDGGRPNDGGPEGSPDAGPTADAGTDAGRTDAGSSDGGPTGPGPALWLGCGCNGSEANITRWEGLLKQGVTTRTEEPKEAKAQ